MNRKGFTLIELLGTIVILGIVSVFTMLTFTRYRDKASKRTFEMMHKGAADAAENYFMEHIGENSVTIDKLVEYDYMERAQDPWNKETVCKGTVNIDTDRSTAQSGDTLAQNYYMVKLTCTRGCTCRIYPGSTPCDC